MVRLKVTTGLRVSEILNCFNSNMVRLKGTQVVEHDASLIGFQFQYGAIKS